MPDEFQDGSKVVDFQEDYLTKDELFKNTNTKQLANLETVQLT